MERFGIVDIGSNTIVLLVYEIQDGRLNIIRHRSEAAHLIDHVHDGIMDRDGIDTAAEVLRDYVQQLEHMGAGYCFADITEPCRIDNQDELVSALQGYGIEICPLSGYEEAYYDYCGMRLSWPDISEGIAFDVGGGSTELISFKDNSCIEAMSFPLGCVRLAHLPLDTDECRRAINNARNAYPSLNRSCRDIIGIGGTMRAAGMVVSALYGTDMIIEVSMLEEVYEKLRANDPLTVQAMQANVKKKRQPVFLPGLHMILEICRIYEAERILISKTNIREGFLLHCLENTEYKNILTDGQSDV